MATTAPKPSAPAAPKLLPWSGDAEADRLIATDPNALLIGFVLDQQITVQQAFLGPLIIRQRLGTLDPNALARMESERVAAAFAKPPAVHRYPRSMAERVQRLCAVLSEKYGGDASAIWRDVADAAELRRRLTELPGFGAQKVTSVVSVLAKQFGIRPRGWESAIASHPTLADVTTPEELAAYQTAKRAHKAELRAQGLLPRRQARRR